jgi:serine/threonine protein phosphatase PrpC
VKNFFRKLFGNKPEPEQPERPPASDMATTAPLTDEQIQSIAAEQHPRFELQQLIAATGQSVGRQRELNEDSLLSLTSTLAGNSGDVPFGLYIVADGMGGHEYGEVASNIAVRAIAGHILKKFHSYLFEIQSEPPEESIQEIMTFGVKQAQRIIQQEAPGSGTTLTAALVFGQQITIAHVGDSRAYTIYQDGRMEVVTRDHSLVRRLEELGQLTAEEAAVHPQRNVLYRALGQGEVLEPDIFTLPFPTQGYLMICSDGLWGVVPDEDMYKIISDSPNLERACQNLVNAANAAGGPDNISVILVQMLS